MYDSGEGGMKRLVIFGAGDMARIAQYYFSRDSEYEVAAFTVHERFVQNTEYRGLPLVGFETLEEWYGPDEFEMFVAVGYKQLNRARAEVYREAKKKNYRLATYVSSKAVHFGDVNCGDNCFILEANVIQPFVKIGNDVVLWSGNHIGHDVVIEDHCFISSHVVLAGHVRVGERSFLGVNACAKDGVTIGANCLIGPGAVILKDTKPGSAHVVKGTPESPVPAERVAPLLTRGRGEG
jgi:sugar O-acyltransferase (sialic acid O-acetyltransferase NeuD family)